MNDELKPCPFCGGEAQLMHEGEWHWVECTLPDCYTMPWKDLGISGAVEVWNTRPGEDSLRAQLADKDKEIAEMTLFRIYDRVTLPDGSIGTLQHPNADGTWRVWFNGKDWRGDQKMIRPDTLVKIDVKEEEMKYV